MSWAMQVAVCLCAAVLAGVHAHVMTPVVLDLGVDSRFDEIQPHIEQAASLVSPGDFVKKADAEHAAPAESNLMELVELGEGSGVALENADAGGKHHIYKRTKHHHHHKKAKVMPAGLPAMAPQQVQPAVAPEQDSNEQQQPSAHPQHEQDNQQPSQSALEQQKPQEQSQQQQQQQQATAAAESQQIVQSPAEVQQQSTEPSATQQQPEVQPVQQQAQQQEQQTTEQANMQPAQQDQQPASEHAASTAEAPKAGDSASERDDSLPQPAVAPTNNDIVPKATEPTVAAPVTTENTAVEQLPAEQAPANPTEQQTAAQPVAQLAEQQPQQQSMQSSAQEQQQQKQQASKPMEVAETQQVASTGEQQQAQPQQQQQQEQQQQQQQQPEAAQTKVVEANFQDTSVPQIQSVAKQLVPEAKLAETRPDAQTTTMQEPSKIAGVPANSQPKVISVPENLTPQPNTPEYLEWRAKKRLAGEQIETEKPVAAASSQQQSSANVDASTEQLVRVAEEIGEAKNLIRLSGHNFNTQQIAEMMQGLEATKTWLASAPHLNRNKMQKVEAQLSALITRLTALPSPTSTHKAAKPSILLDIASPINALQEDAVVSPQAVKTLPEVLIDTKRPSANEPAVSPVYTNVISAIAQAIPSTSYMSAAALATPPQASMMVPAEQVPRMTIPVQPVLAQQPNQWSNQAAFPWQFPQPVAATSQQQQQQFADYQRYFGYASNVAPTNYGNMFGFAQPQNPWAAAQTQVQAAKPPQQQAQQTQAAPVQLAPEAPASQIADTKQQQAKPSDKTEEPQQQQQQAAAVPKQTIHIAPKSQSSFGGASLEYAAKQSHHQVKLGQPMANLEHMIQVNLQEDEGRGQTTQQMPVKHTHHTAAIFN